MKLNSLEFVTMNNSLRAASQRRIETYWLDITSTLVFLAGLIGVAVSVLSIGAWNIFKHSEKHDH